MFCGVRFPKTSVEGHVDVCICVPGNNLQTQSFHSCAAWSWLLLPAFCVISALCSQSLVYALFFRGSCGCVLHNFFFLFFMILYLSTVICSYHSAVEPIGEEMPWEMLDTAWISSKCMKATSQARILSASKTCLLCSFHLFLDVFMTSSVEVFPHIWRFNI